MAGAIGIRIYRIRVKKRDAKGFLPFGSSLLARHPKKFSDDYVHTHASVVDAKDVERSWYFDQVNTDKNSIFGYLRYGTYGFESDLVDQKSKKNNYRRKVTDVEEIPLYFQMWFPDNRDYALAAFQSFQGRSCITLVFSRMKEFFERENPECIFHYSKLMPSDAKGSAFAKSPLKRLSLVKKNASSDLADRYLGVRPVDPIDLEVSVSARRSGTLGHLSMFINTLPKDAQGVLEHDGIEFDEAVAEIRVGGRIRRVNVFGPSADTGVIDISDAVEKGSDGHPTFASLRRQAELLLKDFYKGLEPS